VRVEGCMDSSAANYDAHATVNTRTWCIPSVVGCMIPNSAAGVARSALGKRVDYGGAANFDVSATVHDKSACRLERHGCTDSTAVNHDEYATVDDGSCYARVYGCLDRTALNFGCPDWSPTTCSALHQVHPVTIHEPLLCQMTDSPSAWDSLRPLGDGKRALSVNVRLRMVCQGEVVIFQAAQLDVTIVDRVATATGVDKQSISITLSSASVLVDVTITTASEAAAASIQAALSARVANASAATYWLFPNGESTVLATPQMYAEWGEVVTEPFELPLAAWIAVGVCLAISIGAILTILLMRHRDRLRTWVGKRYAADQIVPVTTDGQPLDAAASDGGYRSPRIAPAGKILIRHGSDLFEPEEINAALSGEGTPAATAAPISAARDGKMLGDAHPGASSDAMAPSVDGVDGLPLDEAGLSPNAAATRLQAQARGRSSRMDSCSNGERAGAPEQDSLEESPLLLPAETEAERMAREKMEAEAAAIEVAEAQQRAELEAKAAAQREAQELARQETLGKLQARMRGRSLKNLHAERKAREYAVRWLQRTIRNREKRKLEAEAAARQVTAVTSAEDTPLPQENAGVGQPGVLTAAKEGVVQVTEGTMAAMQSGAGLAKAGISKLTGGLFAAKETDAGAPLVVAQDVERQADVSASELAHAGSVARPTSTPAEISNLAAVETQGEAPTRVLESRPPMLDAEAAGAAVEGGAAHGNRTEAWGASSDAPE